MHKAVAVLCLAAILSFSTPGLATGQGPPSFLGAWGSLGSSPGQFYAPQGVAVGPSGEVYVSEQGNNRVQVFTSTGSYLRAWLLPGHDGAHNIVVDANGHVFLTNSYDAMIYVFTDTGTLLGQWGGFGSGPGQFGPPGGAIFSLAVDASGIVYVANYRNDRVQVFTPSGAFVREWGVTGSGDGQFRHPDGLAVDPGGNVYVADKGNGRIQKFANDGTYLMQWGSPGTGDGQFAIAGYDEGPVRVALGPEGNLYVVDHGNTRVQVFSGDGTFITKWGRFGHGATPGEFDNPIGIAVDADGNIYVADTNNSRIQKFGFAPTPVARMTWGSLRSRYRGVAQTAGREK